MDIVSGLQRREPNSEEFENQESRIKGVLPTDFSIYETHDTSVKPLISLPAKMLEDYQEHAQVISRREKEAMSNFVYPGANRHFMPGYPQKSKRLREYENP